MGDADEVVFFAEVFEQESDFEQAPDFSQEWLEVIVLK